MKQALIISLLFCVSAFGGLDTATYVTHDGGGSGRWSGDLAGVGEITIEDEKGGDLWNGGDQFMYIHDDDQITGDFSATVRVVSQTEAVDGRWGKAGIQARASLDGNSQNMMAQIAVGNGSQADAPSSGSSHSPVPARAAGRTTADGNNGFEDPIFWESGSALLADGSGNVANNFLREFDTQQVWLRLDYTAASNEFEVGIAADNNGTPGVWNWANTVFDVPADGDGWYVGIGYSAHGDLDIPDGTMHGVTFDNYSIDFDGGNGGGGDPPDDGDFNNDGIYNCADINGLTASIADGQNSVSFDLNGDGLVDTNDRDAWLSEAGEVNLGTGKSYLLGDANLDGVVDVTDFGFWNANKFTQNDEWCSGDFSADGAVDVSDFGLWNGNKFTSSDAAGAPSAVPEPAGLAGLLTIGLLIAIRCRKTVN